MAQWIRRLPTEQEIPGSSPGMGFFFVFAHESRVRVRHFAWMKLGFRSNPWRTARQLFSREQASKKLARIVRDTNSLRRKKAPEVRLELTTYRLTAGRATDCAIQEIQSAMVFHRWYRKGRGSILPFLNRRFLSDARWGCSSNGRAHA